MKTLKEHQIGGLFKALYRRQVENGEIPHPFEANAARRARMSPAEREEYDAMMFQRAREVWRSIR